MGLFDDIKNAISGTVDVVSEVADFVIDTGELIRDIPVIGEHIPLVDKAVTLAKGYKDVKGLFFPENTSEPPPRELPNAITQPNNNMPIPEMNSRPNSSVPNISAYGNGFNDLMGTVGIRDDRIPSTNQSFLGLDISGIWGSNNTNERVYIWQYGPTIHFVDNIPSPYGYQPVGWGNGLVMPKERTIYLSFFGMLLQRIGSVINKIPFELHGKVFTNWHYKGVITMYYQPPYGPRHFPSHLKKL